MASSAHAASLYWVGTNGANVNVAGNWRTSVPPNCSAGGNAGAPPGTGDVAVFDAACDNGATISANWSVAGVQIDSGYTGTITQSAGITLTVGASNYVQSDGTFTGGNSAININGAFTLNGGAFTSTTGTMTVTSGNWTNAGTFTPSTGTVVYHSGAVGTYTLTGATTFYNLTFSGNNAGNQNISDDLVVQNTLSVTRAGSNSTFIFGDGAETHTISVAGNVSHTGQQAMEGDLTIVMNGTGSQTVTTSSTGKIGSLRISNTSAAVVLGSNLLMQGMLTIDASAELDVTASNYNITNTAAVSGGWTKSGTFTQRQGTVEFAASGQAITISGATTFYNLLFSGGLGGAFSISDDLVVSNNLSITRTGSVSTLIFADGTETHTISVAGNATHSGQAAMEGDLTIVMNGTAGQTVTTSSTGKIGSLQISNTSATVELGSNLLMQGMLTIDASAELDVTAANYSIANTGATNGGWTRNGTFTQRQGTVDFVSSAQNITIIGATTFYNLTLSGSSGGTQSISDDLIVENDFHITRTGGGGSTLVTADGVETHTISVAGDALNSGIHHLEDDLTIAMDGATTQTVTTSGTGQIGDLEISNTTAEVQLGANLLVVDDITVDSGAILDLVSYGVTGTVATSFTNNGTLQLQGDQTFTNATPTHSSGSTVEYTATSGSRAIKDWTYHHLTINGSGGTFTMGAGETLAGNLTVTAGTLDVNDQTLAINGNTTIDGGTLMTGTGAVAFGDAGGDSVTISSGMLSVESDSDADITVTAGTWTNSGGTIEFKTDDPVTFMNSAAIQPFYNLEFDGSGQTFVPSTNLDVNAAFTMTDGVLDLNTNDIDINIAGAFAINGGTYTKGSGTLTFDGSGQQINGGGQSLGIVVFE